MKLKDLIDWPPLIADGNGRTVDLDHIVLRISGVPGKTDLLRLRLQSPDGRVYEHFLSVPKHLAYSVAVAIAMIQGRSLGEIGEVELPENHCH